MNKLNEKEILKHIEFAKNLVKDQPEPFKTESFKIILNKLLHSDLSSKQSSSYTSKSSAKLQHTDKNSQELFIVENLDEKLLNLSNELGIELDKLKDTISISNNKIEILTQFQGSNKAEKTIKAISCILLIFDRFFNSSWVKSEVIAEYLRDLGLPDTGRNMSSYMKQNVNLFRMKGSGRFKEYKLTTPEGKDNALVILKQLSSGEV